MVSRRPIQEIGMVLQKLQLLTQLLRLMMKFEFHQVELKNLMNVNCAGS